MTVKTYYVGAGGNDAADGLSYANRKLTLNGAEDIPVAAGDTVYIAPGVYRELLTVDVSGGAGAAITYIGDVTGEHTDGVGGYVRVTGSDDDQANARNNAITGTSKNYRTFQGLCFDMCNQHNIANIGGTNWTIQDCSFRPAANGYGGVSISGATQAACTIQRCSFLAVHGVARGVNFTHTVAVDATGHLVQNCRFIGGAYGITSTRIGGITVKNCTFLAIAGGCAMQVLTALTAGQTVTINNCILQGCSVALQATALGEITENYNTLAGNSTDRTNVGTGANSLTYPPIFTHELLELGYRFPRTLCELSSWSQVRAVAGTGEATDDLYGVARPATAAKCSWGAIQYQGQIRDVATVRGGAASLKLPDAGRAQFMVPTSGVAVTISVYCYREANYAGTAPQMLIRQPGVTDITVTDAGAAAGWNQLSQAFTPAATTDFVVVELVSGNSAVAGSYAVYWDDLSVS